jgi:hypothetical protein
VSSSGTTEETVDRQSALVVYFSFAEGEIPMLFSGLAGEMMKSDEQQCYRTISKAAC